ncbi:hypothetical protein ACFVTM_04505 [Arthrobacter sp. NPDC058130]|uniref:hypothetical protein n=1 Tax=Arthrobacter sp. NPDC058130 TaxID=3346353 RepID=UPI0036F0E449
MRDASPFQSGAADVGPAVAGAASVLADSPGTGAWDREQAAIPAAATLTAAAASKPLRSIWVISGAYALE